MHVSIMKISVFALIISKLQKCGGTNWSVLIGVAILEGLFLLVNSCSKCGCSQEFGDAQNITSDDNLNATTV